MPEADKRVVIEGLIALARWRVVHDWDDFLRHWRDYTNGTDSDLLTKEQALAALDWLSKRLDIPVNSDA